MKFIKFIIPFPVNISIIMFSVALIMVVLALDAKLNSVDVKSSITCTYVGFDKSPGGDLRIKLKCGDKEYYSNDNDLILWVVENPGKEIKATLRGDDKVVMTKEDK